MTAKEEIIEERRVRNRTMTAINKPDEFDDDDVDEMTVVIKPCFREILRFKCGTDKSWYQDGEARL